MRVDRFPIWMDATARLWGRWNVVDAMAVLTVAATALGLLMVQAGWHQTSGQAVEGETDIEYTVLMYGLRTLRPELFQVGDQTSITIRNHPRGKVTITQVERQPRRLVVPAVVRGAQGYEVIEDPTLPDAYEYRLTLKDHALKTSEGFVTNGMKVKIGLPIEVEGFDYRVSGVIVDVRPTTKAVKAVAE